MYCFNKESILTDGLMFNKAEGEAGYEQLME